MNIHQLPTESLTMNQTMNKYETLGDNWCAKHNIVSQELNAHIHFTMKNAFRPSLSPQILTTSWIA
jgi:hypothetical protein